MSAASRTARIHDLLDQLYRDRRECLSGPEIAHRAGGLDLSPPLRRLVDALPEGPFRRDQAEAELTRIQREEGMWRDESRTSEADLVRALATSAGDGQVDDLGGNEAGPSEEFRDADQLADPAEREPTGDREPEPDSMADRRLRAAPEGRSGPH